MAPRPPNDGFAVDLGAFSGDPARLPNFDSATNVSCDRVATNGCPAKNQFWD
jgi:hypothetical protein